MPPHSRSEGRLIIAERVMQYFEDAGMFHLRSVDIWDRANSEALGGRLHDSIEPNSYKSNNLEFKNNLTENYYRRFYNSIIMFEGEWNINGHVVDGFISVNNDYSWRKTYYDIEVDCYSKGEIDDIVELFLGLEYFKDMFQDFLEYMKVQAGDSAFHINRIFYSYGVPHPEDLENILVLHTNSLKAFVNFLYQRLKADNDAWFKSNVRPYTRNTYLNELFEHELTEKKIYKFHEDTELLAVPGGSITYIAGKEDSFIAFYKKFKEELFMPIAKSLPSDKELRSYIRRVLSKTSTLDNFTG